ncbi:MutS-related protein [Hymenobacter weizhouensis]|uniref:MutS-related protein n=1 Tax=Hymenobacter sp. YIM 151500-1 TaxID=2987689 RepID=UPI002226CE2C|nr:DNA mismatch repair protein MutS [Hymenobacter sp. YIM 151500-1]UYZ62958.1 DNA mismatch repair protein MutS [Hymenobacter sp. YIM 151500-1]
MPISPEYRPLTVLPAELFQANLAHHEEQEKQQARRHQVVALVRLAVFGGGVAGAWALFADGQPGAALGVVLGVYLVFLGLMRWHAAVSYRRRHHGLLAQLNHDELARLAGRLSGFDPGLRYLTPDHPYAADLDVFGAHSLFQLLNRSTSRLGQDWLAGWLLAPAAPPVVRERQQAAAELAPDVAWQQEWQARARHFPRQEADPRRFAAWLAQPDVFATRPWLLPVLVALPVAAVAGVVALLTGYGAVLLGVAVLGTSLLNLQLGTIRAEYYEQATAMRDALRAAHSQLTLFEAGQWQSAGLRRLHRAVHPAAGPASRLLEQLSGVAGWFSLRQNPAVAGVLNALLLWDAWGVWQLERWKRRLSGQLTPLLEAAAELDALVSLAAFRAANPAFAAPDLTLAPLSVTAEAVVHPLIFGAEPVANDFHTAGAGQTVVVTGSNMAGKSTFLRTVGLNLVLAQAGAVVAARTFGCGPAQVFTAMRTHDNLAESTSSFYAELKRLRLLLDLTQNKASSEAEGENHQPAPPGHPSPNHEKPTAENDSLPVFYLLDEILKGTNSQDRHRGARALVHQLHRRPASGLLSTHDLELAALEQELPGAVRNVSFNSFLNPTDGTLHFDYRLTPGVCRSFNASQLMRLMGIAVDEEPSGNA